MNQLSLSGKPATCPLNLRFLCEIQPTRLMASSGGSSEKVCNESGLSRRHTQKRSKGDNLLCTDMFHTRITQMAQHLWREEFQSSSASST